MRRFVTLTLLTGLLVVAISMPEATNVSAVSHSSAPPAKKVCKTKKVHGKKKKVCKSAKPKPTPTPTPTLSLAQQVDNTLTSLQFSGSILLEKGGQILLEKSYGMADRASNTPNTPQTRVPVFGVNGFMAAVGIMKLQEEGKLSIQDKLCSYISNCPAAWQPISIEELLNHTDGMAGWEVWPSSTGDTETTLTTCEAQPMASTPGQQVGGTDCESFLLNTVIEKVSGKSWSDFMQQTIFGPAGMTNSGRMTNSLLPQRARGYIGSDPGQDVDFDAYYMAYSTLEDVYRFDTALLAGKIISPQSLAAMVAPGPALGTSPEGGTVYAGYGGLGVGKASDTPPPGWTRPHEREVGTIGGGEGTGFSITNQFSPDDGAVLLLLNNDTGAVNDAEETNLRAGLLRPGLFGKP
jgi:CubicO group peptidase (beta-lactamase class C family)